jgi:superfamily I DNA/RNA helicase
MELGKEYFNARELPLRLTYRCAKNIVMEAYQVFPDIEALETAPDGNVRHHSIGELNNRCIIVCRNNKPLIAEAYALLSQGVACHVRGRDIGDNLVRLINKLEAFNVENLIDKVYHWADTEIAKAAMKEDEDKIQRVCDKRDSLLIFTSKCKLTDSPDAVKEQIKKIFEQGKGVCLSTVHKAKGLEAEKCVILNRELLPGYDGRKWHVQRARHAWQKEQELNALYVAITRAKSELVYIRSDANGQGK